MQPFLDALEKFKQIDSSDTFSQVFHLFKAINEMDKPTVIAAYQTLCLFARQTGQAKTMYSDENPLNDAREALVGRMQMLCSEIPAERRNDAINGYCAATGIDKAFFWRVAVR